MTTFDLESSFAAADARPAPRPDDAGPAFSVRQLQAEVESLPTEDDILEKAAASACPRSSERKGRAAASSVRLGWPVLSVVTIAPTLVMLGTLFRRQRGHEV